MNLWPKHLYALDVSRSLAALSVVLYHWRHFAYTYKGTPSPQDLPLYGILKLFYEEAPRGLQYFYLLSGFVFFWLYKESIKIKSTHFKDFWVQRLSRLYPLHFVTLLIVALLQLLYVSRQGTSFVYPFNDGYHFLLNLGLASKWGLERGESFNGPVGVVSIQIMLYLIFFLMASFRLGGLLFCLAATVISLVFLKLHAIFSGATLFFLGGAVFHLTFILSTRKRQKLRNLIYLMTVFCWAGVIINCYLFDLSGLFLEFGKIGQMFLVGFPLCILLPITLCSLALYEIDRGPLLKSVSWVGDISYSSYLLHFPLQLLFALAVGYGLLSSGFYLNPLYLVLFFIFLVPLSYIVFLKFERPIQKMIRDQFSHPTKA